MTLLIHCKVSDMLEEWKSHPEKKIWKNIGKKIKTGIEKKVKKYIQKRKAVHIERKKNLLLETNEADKTQCLAKKSNVHKDKQYVEK